MNNLFTFWGKLRSLSLYRRYSFVLLLAMLVTLLQHPVYGSSVTKQTLLSGSADATPYYVIESGKSGPVVMITAGVHGSERAPIRAADDIRTWSISKGTLIVVPRCNIRAANASTRTFAGVDLNRSFPEASGEKVDNPIANALLDLIKTYKVDWLMDMHEGTDYSKSNSDSVGQSVIYMPGSKGSETFANKLIKDLNKDINKLSNGDKFSLLKYPVKGSLARAAAEVHKARSLIFETCSRDSMNNRVGLATRAAEELLKHTGLKY